MSQECKDTSCNNVSDDFGLIDIFSPNKNIFDKIVIGSFSFICLAMSVLLTLIICAVTFVRYILQGDLYGFEEWVKLMAFWLYFSGAAIGAYNRTHVSADLVSAYIKEGKFRQFLVFLRYLLTVSTCLLFVWYGWDFFYFGFMGPLGTGIAIPKTSAWRIPLWIGYLSVFSGLAFMAFYFMRDLILSGMILFGLRRNK